MKLLPSSFYSLLASFAPHFTARTFPHVALLTAGAILARGRRTVTAIIRAARPWMTHHFTTFHRVLSRSRWSPLMMNRTLLRVLIARFPEGATIPLVLDDTLFRRRGPKVFGKGCHRDAIRSTHARHVTAFGHRWMVLAVLVPMPFGTRPWALPFLMMRYRDPKHDPARRHRTPIDLAVLMVRLVARWFPQHRVRLVGDGAFGAIELAAACRGRVRLVSRLHRDAAWYEPPPPRRPGQQGRPRKKGAKLPTPRQTVSHAEASWHTAALRWYGGGTRELQWMTGAGHWYRAGKPVVWVRWVWTRHDDAAGQTRDECFFTTDPTLTAEQVITAYADRWSIEVTFQEARAHLAVEQTRNWSRVSVTRAAPALMALFTLVSLWYREHGEHQPANVGEDSWYQKTAPTFADALVHLRRAIWREKVFPHSRNGPGDGKLPDSLRAFVYYSLTAA